MFSRGILLFIFAIVIVYSPSEGGPFNDQPYVRLMNAVRGEVLMPVVELGTGGYGYPNGTSGEFWGPEQAHNATLAWLKMGGRRIDTADNYDSADGVGTGWKASGISRFEIFITSKVSANTYDATMQSFNGILKSFQIDYVDLLLIHAPGYAPGKLPPLPDCWDGKSSWINCRIQTWRALETLLDQNKVRAIGVSSFEVNHLLDIINLNSSIPSINQVEFHLYWHQDELLDFCKKYNITYNSFCLGGTPDHAVWLGTSWNPIPDQRTHPSVIEIAKKHDKSPAQIIYRWQWQQGIIINPRTLNSTHMMENLSIFDFELDAQDMMTLSYLKHPKISKICGDPRIIL